MSIIKAENLTFSYPSSSENIFENINFHIDTNWKLGFIGRNGRGKTTFLKLLMGEYEYSGNIISSVDFEYFPYPVTDKSRMTEDIIGEICPEAEQWEILRELNLLNAEPDILWRPFETLSNGERTKVLLSALFLKNGCFPLIDEPTNHLDSVARNVVADYLKRKRGFILVSHDRCFLDGCVDHILSINRTTIDVQNGNFSSWSMNFERQQKMESARNEHLKKDIRRLRESSERASQWSDKTEKKKYGEGPVDRGYVGHKSAKMMKRSKSIETRRKRAVEEKTGLLKNTETADSLKITPLKHHLETLLSCSSISIKYGNKIICEPISFSVRQGDRVALEGGNGSGKSSLIKALLGQDVVYSGYISTASGLVISYVPQDTYGIKGRLYDIAEKDEIDESLFKAILRKMGFEREQFDKNIENFSEGQKKKTLIARSLCQQAHIYIWDEPLNYIDIYSRMQIEGLINEFKPTMIFVEHDLAFRKSVATKTVELKKLKR